MSIDVFPPLLAHSGTPTSTNDPLFTFGNNTALALFGYSRSEFLGMPSRLSALPDDQAAREEMMKQARDVGFILGYQGDRVHKSGSIFQIKEGVIWNLCDDKEKIIGQAALIPDVITEEGKEIKYGTTRDRTQATGLASNPSIHRTAFNFFKRFLR